MVPAMETKEECWNRFWAIMGPALVELHQQGDLPAEEEQTTVAA